MRTGLPAVSELGEREQVLVSAWLTGLRSARTPRAYAGDVVAWLGWLAKRGTDVLAAGRVHVDLWAATQLDSGVAASSVRRRLSALSSFYRYCAAHDLISDRPHVTGCVPSCGNSAHNRSRLRRIVSDGAQGEARRHPMQSAGLPSRRRGPSAQ